MRKYELSPAIIADLRMRALAAPFREVGVPLYMPALDTRMLTADSFAEADAEDARIEAGGITIGDEDDDDFY